MKRCLLIAVVMGITVLSAAYSFAMCGTCDVDSAKSKAAAPSAASVNVGNETCPVSGEPANSMSPVTVEYKGKAYNLCCPACIATFNADPEKYIAKVAQQETKKK